MLKELESTKGVEKDRPSSYLGSVFLRDSCFKNLLRLNRLVLLFAQQMLLALEGVPSVAGMSRKQLMFVLQVRNLQGLVRGKMVKFNPELSQILRKVFLPKNMPLELTKH